MDMMASTELNLLAVQSEVALVDRLVAHCDAYNVRRVFEQFAATNADEFSDFDADDEHSHNRHALFQAYEALFEEALRDFLTSEQMSPSAFYHTMRTLQSDPDCPNSALNLTMILSSALDFDAFGEVMRREAIAQQQASKEAHDMGL